MHPGQDCSTAAKALGNWMRDGEQEQNALRVPAQVNADG